MAGVKIEQGTLTHRKTLRLKGLLGIGVAQAVGHLTMLWVWAASSTKDGSLTSVSMNGGSLQLGYDSLSRLASAGNGVYTRSYTYRDISSTQTTTQVQSLGYTGLSGALSGLTYNYTYNALGNIASVAKGSGTATTYTAAAGGGAE